jgi:DNA-binding PadR family transcriptional regulator
MAMNATYAIRHFPPQRSHGLRAAMRAMAGGGERGRGGRRHHRGGERFHMQFGGPPFGFGGPFGRGGPKARRGDVRTATLLLLAEGPRNGYQIMQDIEERSGGVWRPSPGSVYPALQQLEDEGLVRADETEGRRTYALTDEGRGYVEENRDDLGEPWKAVGAMDAGVMELRGQIAQVAAAAIQCSASGHAEDAKRILAEARRSLYRVLAEEEPEEG